MDRGLAGHRAGLRRPAVGLGGRGHRPGLPGRVPDREEPVAGQRVRVRGDLRRVRDPGPLPAPRADARHHRRPDHAGRVHRGGRHPAGGLPPGHLPVRGGAAVRRGPDAARRAARPARAQPCAAGRAPGPAGHRAPARPAVRRPGWRPPAGYPAAGDAGRGRGHRPDLRRRLHPGGPGRHHRHVRGLHVQRVRRAGHAGAVLPARRGGVPVPLPAARTGDHPGRRRGQAADRRPLRGPRLGLARLHRRRPGRRRHPVHP